MQLPPVTRGLLIANVLMFLLQLSTGDALLAHFALWPLGAPHLEHLRGAGSGLVGFEPWQLVTYSFLHGNLPHIAFNMLALAAFGPVLERLLGPPRYLLLYGLSGLAGGTKAIVFQLASLTDVHWTMSGEVVLMTLLGGMGTVFGPVAGALVVLSMENYLAQLGSWVTVVQGCIFVVCVLTFRRGIVGELAHLLKKSL